MNIMFNPPAISIKLIKSELVELWQYLNKCDKEAFSGIHHYKHQLDRELMYKWHLKDIATKVFAKVFAVHHEANNKKVALKLTQIEQHTLSVMFKRVDCNPYMLQLQTRFINGLVKLS